jgi:Integrase zinc binding domain
VPIGLRQAIYTAYHATPLAGHVGFYKTYWRIAARYYWPSMYSDVRQAVLECGHCILGNNTSHHAQQILGSLSMDDEPFDIIAIDIWIPGATKAKGTYIEDKAMIRQAALTSLCNLTGFATVGFLDSLEGEKVTKVLMSQILLPNGLPKLVLLDADSLFKQDLIVLLDELGVGFHVVSAEQHVGILCERFHRYLNKVQRLQGLDTKEYSNWMMNTSFTSYAWNGSPIDGMDIIRSFAAKARTFHFPLDVKERLPRIIGNPGERALQHVETMFPLWFLQKELLQILYRSDD